MREQTAKVCSEDLFTREKDRREKTVREGLNPEMFKKKKGEKWTSPKDFSTPLWSS